VVTAGRPQRSKGVYQDRDGARWDQAVTRSSLNHWPPRKTNECGNMRQRSHAMSQVSTQEFDRLGLRVHDFLAGVPLHDVWAVDLPRTRPGITLTEFLRAAGGCPFSLPAGRARTRKYSSLYRTASWLG